MSRLCSRIFNSPNESTYLENEKVLWDTSNPADRGPDTRYMRNLYAGCGNHGTKERRLMRRGTYVGFRWPATTGMLLAHTPTTHYQRNTPCTQTQNSIQWAPISRRHSSQGSIIVGDTTTVAVAVTTETVVAKQSAMSPRKQVQFSLMSTMVIVDPPTHQDNISRSYSHQEIIRFRRELIRDIQTLRSKPREDLVMDDLIKCIGAEQLLWRSMTRRSMEKKRHLIDAVLQSQGILSNGERLFSQESIRDGLVNELIQLQNGTSVCWMNERMNEETRRSIRVLNQSQRGTAFCLAFRCTIFKSCSTLVFILIHTNWFK